MIDEFLKSAKYRNIHDISPIVPLRPNTRVQPKKTPSPVVKKEAEVSQFEGPHFSSTAPMGNASSELNK
jgi:hypothetical protein